MNTRLQVEHPVTECVTGARPGRGCSCVVAEGGPLPLDGPPPLRGHAIEVRLYAEDPAARLAARRPARCTASTSPGVAPRSARCSAPGLRLDAGVADGSVVGVHYDPMLAKVIAWAPTRAEAAARCWPARWPAPASTACATNRDLLVRVLRHPAFLSGGTDTGFLDRQPRGVRAAAGRGGRGAAVVPGRRAGRAAAPAPGRDACRAAAVRLAQRAQSALQTAVYEGPTGPSRSATGWTARTTWRPGRCAASTPRTSACPALRSTWPARPTTRRR